jgi:hypothetical protein
MCLCIYVTTGRRESNSLSSIHTIYVCHFHELFYSWPWRQEDAYLRTTVGHLVDLYWHDVTLLVCCRHDTSEPVAEAAIALAAECGTLWSMTAYTGRDSLTFRRSSKLDKLSACSSVWTVFLTSVSVYLLFLCLLLDSEDWGSKCLQNARQLVPFYTASHRGRSYSLKRAVFFPCNMLKLHTSDTGVGHPTVLMWRLPVSRIISKAYAENPFSYG